MTRPYLLWLIWRNVHTRQRFRIGNLIHESGIYKFEYENKNKHRGLNEALENGYRPHLAFPDLKRVYVSDKLFGPFSRRLPNTSRPDFSKLLAKYGLASDYTQMDLLRVKGGRLATDSYEFTHPVYIESSHFDFDFHIAGWRHYDGDEYLENLTCDTELFFEKEPSNGQDPFAIMVKTIEGALLGYVPAFFSEFMTQVIDKGCYYQIKVEDIDTHAIPQLKVDVSVTGELTNYFKGMPQYSNDLIPIQPV